MADQVSNETLAALTAHTWTPQPEPARLVHELLNRSLERNSFAARLSQKMLLETGTRMLDWIDHFGLATNDVASAELSRVGFVQDKSNREFPTWKHSGGLFPRLRQLPGTTRQLAIKVDSVADFLFAHNLAEVKINGEPFAPLRTACVAQENDTELLIVERH